jgi:hypothetical protein
VVVIEYHLLLLLLDTLYFTFRFVVLHGWADYPGVLVSAW